MGTGASTRVASTEEAQHCRQCADSHGAGHEQLVVWPRHEIHHWLDTTCASLCLPDQLAQQLIQAIEAAPLATDQLLMQLQQKASDLLQTVAPAMLQAKEQHQQAMDVLARAKQELLIPEFHTPLDRLPDVIDQVVYVHDRIPLILDVEGQVLRFMKYQRGNVLMASQIDQMEPKRLRRELLNALHFGNCLVVVFDAFSITKSLDEFCCEKFFPPQVMKRNELFAEPILQTLLQDDDEIKRQFPQFLPKDQFRLVLLYETSAYPTVRTLQQTALIRIISKQQLQSQSSDQQQQPLDELVAQALGVKETKRNSLEMLEAAFDNELETIKNLLEKGYYMESQDGHGHTPLSEASCQGNDAIVRFLLDKGSDPNTKNDEARTPLYRAAYNGHASTVQLLLQHGADPRVVSKQGETAFDVAKNQPVRDLLSQWSLDATDKLLEERRKWMEAQLALRITSHVEREQLAIRKIHQELIELATSGNKDQLSSMLESLLDEALENQEQQFRATADVRNDKGSTLLSIACQHDHAELVEYLLTRYKAFDPHREFTPQEQADACAPRFLSQQEIDQQLQKTKALRPSVNARDMHGWTPVSIAVFHQAKRCLRLLLEHGADPYLKNQYNKNAMDLAQDDLDAAGKVYTSRQEIRQVLEEWEAARHQSKVVAMIQPDSEAQATPKPTAASSSEPNAQLPKKTGAKSKVKDKDKSDACSSKKKAATAATTTTPAPAVTHGKDKHKSKASK